MTATAHTRIRNALLFDGSGSPPREGDVLIEDGRIAAIGDVSGAAPAQELDAGGLALCPGFIDVHTHDDFAALVHSDMGFKLTGGVTTDVVGNCGFGAAPFAAAMTLAQALHPRLSLSPYEGFDGYFAALEARRPGCNVAALAGHGTLRLAAMGSARRRAGDADMAAMKSLLHEALDAGVVGLSSGLIYEPGRNADTDELVELVASLRGSGALYATHMRDEGTGLLAAVSEAIAIGERGGAPVQISHHKAAGREAWGLVERSLRLIEAAQARGLDVHADQYPYTAGSTLLQAVLDNGAFLDDPGPGGIGRVRAEDVNVASAPGHPQWEGESIAALAAAFATHARDAAQRVADQAHGATVILHMMSEDDVRTVMRHPSTMIGSDGIPTLDGKPHPRINSTFARVIGRYARDAALFPLAEAIHRMTGFPARKFGFADRGVLRDGAFADLVLFDPATIIDRATYDEPLLAPAGIHHVFVNGVHAVRDGTLTGRRGGRVLRRA